MIKQMTKKEREEIKKMIKKEREEIKKLERDQKKWCCPRCDILSNSEGTMELKRREHQLFLLISQDEDELRALNERLDQLDLFSF